MLSDNRTPYQRIVDVCKRTVLAFPNFNIDAIDHRTYADSQYDVIAIQPKHIRADVPTLFVIAGFHGEEPAGPMAIADTLESLLSSGDQINVFIVPCANPWGYDHNIRHTPISEVTNGGYVHGYDVLSPEFTEIKNLIEYARPEFYLDLHEDNEAGGAYLYCFNHRDIGKQMLERLSLNIPREDKPIMDDPIIMNADIREGIVYDAHDGSSEDFASHIPGNVVALALETPSSKFPLSHRIQTHATAVDEMIMIAKKHSIGG